MTPSTNPVAALQAQIAEAASSIGARPQAAEPGLRSGLAEALVHAAQLQGLPATAARAVSGLPLAAGGLGLDHAPAAARAVGLDFIEDKRPLRHLKAGDCPLVGIAPDGAAAVIERLKRQGWRGLAADVRLMPDGGQAVWTGRQLKRLRRFLTPPAERASAAPGLDEPGPEPFLKGIAKGAAGLYGQAVFATIAINILALAVPLFTMNVYDRVLPNNAIETLHALAIGALLATGFDFLLKQLRGALVDTAGRRADVILSNRIFGRLIGARLPARPQPAGAQASTLREFETLRELSSSAVLTVLGDLPFALLFLAIIAVIAGPLAWVPVLAVPVLVAASLAVNIPLARLQAAAFKDTAIKNAIVVETLHGLETIKALNVESWAAGRYERSAAEGARIGFWNRFWSALSQNISGLVLTCATIAMVVWGVALAGAGVITAGALMASMMLIGRILAPFAQLAALASRLNQAAVAWKAVKRITQEPQERENPARFVSLPEKPGVLAFEGVTFAYDPRGQPALSNASAVIQPGERVGLIGAIGSGKSTFLKLIAGLHQPQSGRILVGGLALGDIDPAEFRPKLAFLGQSPMLFQGTIRQNICIHNPAMTRETLLNALNASGALAWISRMPRGLDSVLGEGGHGLSGGQRQSLALARGLAARPDIIMLDEPTSDMDGRTETQVISGLAQYAQGKTLLIVTHRTPLLDLVDRLIVFDSGKIMADGPKEKVLGMLRQQQAKPEAGAAA